LPTELHGRDQVPIQTDAQKATKNHYPCFFLEKAKGLTIFAFIQPNNFVQITEASPPCQRLFTFFPNYYWTRFLLEFHAAIRFNPIKSGLVTPVYLKSWIRASPAMRASSACAASQVTNA